MNLDFELLIIKTSMEIAYLKLKLFVVELQLYLYNKGLI